MSTVVHVDVSDLLRTGAATGIQRVVRQVVPRLAARDDLDLRLLRFDPELHLYAELDRDSVLARLHDPAQEPVVTGHRDIRAFGPGDVFLDLDSAWNSPLKRSTLYPGLAEAGATIVSYVYDVVPLRVPDVVQATTTANWLLYFAAVLAHADLVLTDSRSAEGDLRAWAERLGVHRDVPTLVTRLGSDLPAGEPTPEELASLEPLGHGRFLLFVGTIEPRKQQRLALAAYDVLSRRHHDLHLVFAGRKGWLADDAVQAITAHERFGTRVHWIEAPSDALLGELYRRATACLYLSRYEGFGLPIAEALGHGRVTVATRGSSTYEVGKEACDYTFFDTPEEIAETLAHYLGDPALLAARERHIREEFRTLDWDTVAGTIGDALTGLERAAELRARPRPDDLQLVFISNDPVKVARTIGLYDERAPFVREYVVVAPTAQLEAVAAVESTRKVVAVDEGRILAGREEEFRAADHQGKNWMLRSGLVGLEEVDDVFVMLDDDNLPLGPLEVGDFYADDGRFHAFHFFDLVRWGYRVSEFDDGQRATAATLDPEGFELLAYASHQPQVIDKQLLREAVDWADRHATRGNLCEWATYFNLSVTRYPTLFRKLPFRALNWPGRASDWSHQYHPSTYRFENYYSKSYSKGLFVGLTPADPAERKLARKRGEVAPHDRTRRLFDRSLELLRRDGLAHGMVRFAAPDVTVLVTGLPQLVTVAAGSVLHLDVSFQVLDRDPRPREVEIGYRVLQQRTPVATVRRTGHGPTAYAAGLAVLPVVGRAPGTYELEWQVRVDGEPVADPGVRYLASLVVLAGDQRPGPAYRSLGRASAPAGPPVVRLRRAAKSVLRRAAPWVDVDGEGLRTMHAVRSVVEPLPATVADLRKASDATLEGLATVERRQAAMEAEISRLRAAAHGPTDGAPSLTRLRALVAAAGVEAPVHGLAGLDTEPARELVARLRVIEDHLGRLVGRRVLVVGSAFGFVPLYLAERGAKATGWESHVPAAEVAREVARFTGARVTLGSPVDVLDRIRAVPDAEYDVAVVDPTVDPDDEQHAAWVAALAERVPVVIHDAPASYAPEGEDERVLGRFPWRSHGLRPLVARTRPQVVTVDGRDYPYERTSAEAYAGSPLARRDGFRRYYFGPTHVVKEYRYQRLGDQELRQPLREINVHVNGLAGRTVWHGPRLVGFELGPSQVRLAFETLPGRLLHEVAPLEEVDVVRLALDLLRTLHDLGSAGLHHNDVRSWNVLVGERGAWLIDYGLASPEASEDDALALLWTLHTALTGDREGFATDKREAPPAGPFEGTPLAAVRDAVVAGERRWSALLDVLVAT